MARWMEIVWAHQAASEIAIAIAVGLVTLFIILEAYSIRRKCRSGRSLTSALLSTSTPPLCPRKKSHAGKTEFFIPELEAVHLKDVPKVVSAATTTTIVPDGEDILSDMYAEKAAVISMLNSLREELVASESPTAVRAIDVLVADIQRRDVNSVWQLGASRIAGSTK